MGLRWRIRVVYWWASPLLRPFWTQNFVPSKIGQEFPFCGKWGRNVKFCFRDSRNVHPFAKRRHLTYWFVPGLGSREEENSPKVAESLCTRPPAGAAAGSGSNNPLLNRDNFLLRVPDLITHAKFGGHRFGGFGDSGGQISPSSIELSSLKNPGTTVPVCDSPLFGDAVDIFNLFFRWVPNLVRTNCNRHFLKPGYITNCRLTQTCQSWYRRSTKQFIHSRA